MRMDEYMNKNKSECTTQKLLFVISTCGLKHFMTNMMRKRIKYVKSL